MRPWAILSAVLVAAGIALFLYKVLVLRYPLSTAERGGTWRVELVVNVSSDGGRVVIDAALPRNSGYQTLLSEELRSRPLQFSISEDDFDRLGRWSGMLSGSATVSYQATVEAVAHARPLPETQPRESYPEGVGRFLEDSAGIQATDAAIADLSGELALEKGDKVKLVKEIYRFVSREIGSLRTTGAMDALSVVREGRGTALGRARLYCALARANGIPCRVVSGIFLEDGTQDSLHHWNEVYVGGGWVPLDVVEWQIGSIPAGRLGLASSSGVAVEAAGTTAFSYRFDVLSELETYVDLMQRRLSESSSILDRYSLLFFPVHLQQSLRLLLLVPLGALAMTVLRSIVGLRTFGMFMPMLIALALTATGLLWGTVFLILVIAVSLVTRILIQNLYLLLVARIAFILTFVVILLVVLMLSGDFLRVPSAGVSAFPFVIITMIVERISVSLEEEGWRNTLNRVGTTLVSIYLTYGVIQARFLQSFLLVFPEFLVVVLGLLIAVGRYTGYRLTELVRFRELTAAPKTERPGGGN